MSIILRMNPTEVPTWITAALWCARFILLVLAGLSIWSVATMIKCQRLLKVASGGEDSEVAYARIEKLIAEHKLSAISSSATASSLSEENLYQALTVEITKFTEPFQIEKVTRSLLTRRKVVIERELTVLATLGANAPFVGLFGTVLGVIQAFGSLGVSQSNAASVMAAISEALVATAVGLFVAIPAVVAFNFLSRKLRVLITNCEALRDLYIAHLDRKPR
jgi:biopolymer transport protein ExbB